MKMNRIRFMFFTFLFLNLFATNVFAICEAEQEAFAQAKRTLEKYEKMQSTGLALDGICAAGTFVLCGVTIFGGFSLSIKLVIKSYEEVVSLRKEILGLCYEVENAKLDLAKNKLTSQKTVGQEDSSRTKPGPITKRFLEKYRVSAEESLLNQKERLKTGKGILAQKIELLSKKEDEVIRNSVEKEKKRLVHQKLSQSQIEDALMEYNPMIEVDQDSEVIHLRDVVRRCKEGVYLIETENERSGSIFSF